MRDGRLLVHRADFLARQLQALKDGPVEFLIEPRRVTRNPDDNVRYWTKVVRPVAQQTQQRPDDVHAILTVSLLPRPIAIANADGRIVAECVVGASTRRLSPPEFRDFYWRARAWALEVVGLELP